jgi:hypothetical protein
MKALANQLAVSADDPLRVAVAAKIAVPDGSMTASGLRREAARGRLRIERIAEKGFTALGEIERKREPSKDVANLCPGSFVMTIMLADSQNIHGPKGAKKLAPDRYCAKPDNREKRGPRLSIFPNILVDCR